jgi:hypothetical protein
MWTCRDGIQTILLAICVEYLSIHSSDLVYDRLSFCLFQAKFTNSKIVIIRLRSAYNENGIKI